jgi:site-specific DNA-cytosine methylase
MQGDGETALQDHAQTVLADSRPGVLVPQVFRKSARARSTEDAETWVNDGDANTLNVFDVGDTRSTHAVVKPVAFDKMNFTISDDHQVLRAGTRQSTGVVEPLPMSARVNTSLDEPPTLMAQSSPNRGGSSGPIQMTSYGVRRLTPVECERLQAFPDGWTEPAGSDSARYKALGNAITVNVAAWLFSRILEVDDDALR